MSALASRRHCGRPSHQRGVRAIEALELRRLLAGAGPDGFGYLADAHAYEPIDLVPGAAGVVTLIDDVDDMSVPIPLGGNTFNFYGTAYTGSASLFVSSNALISFGSGSALYTNLDLTTAPEQRAVAVFWDDLNTAAATPLAGAANDCVLYQLDEANDRLIVEWNAIRHLGWNGGDATFQAILQLNTGVAPGDITLNYPDLSFGNPSFDDGNTATVGIKDAGTQGPNRLLISHNNGSNPLLGSAKAIRIVPGTGGISGLTFEDRDADGVRDANEPGLPGWVIYLDDNDNAQLDVGERFTTTDEAGNYAFANVPTGVRTLRQVAQPGWMQTAPLVSGQSGVVRAQDAAAGAIGAAGAAKAAFTSTEVIASVAGAGKDALKLLKKAIGGGTNALREMLDLEKSKVMSGGSKTSLLELKLKRGADPLDVVARLSALAGIVEWAAPNYVHAGPDPREMAPNDPSYGSQWFHAKMQNNLAWDTTQGEGIIVAVTDDGIDWDHPDLAENIWINGDEVIGNGVDDDANGYVDDVMGWDFSSNDNNPDHVGADTHGTHVAGIVAARTNNALGVAGVAGRARIMPIRFYGSGLWTSSIIFNSYKYAIDNGAKIVTTSYNIDSFVGDPTYLAAINYIYDAGALHFNSAGNSGLLNPARLVHDQTLYVASSDSGDLKSGFSNYGGGIDITAPGSLIYSTLPNAAYGTGSGTSMAAPAAAATAALIWSAHPTWTRDQVAAHLLGSADDIDGINPSYAGLIGAGRVNSFRGVSEAQAPPRLRGITGLPPQDAVTTVGVSAFALDLLDILDPATAIAPGSYELRGDGSDNLFGTADDILIPLTLQTTTYRIGTNALRFSVGGSLSAERYRFSALSGSDGAEGLRNPFGAPLDGNGDGTGGDAFTRTFTLINRTAARQVAVTANTVTADVTFGDFPTAFVGSDGIDRYYLRGDAEGNVDLWLDALPVDQPDPDYTIARSRLETLLFSGSGGDDQFVLDYSFGDPIPQGAVTIAGGDGSDTLRLIGTAAADAVALDAIRFSFSGSAKSAHETLERICYDGLNGGDTVMVEDGGFLSFDSTQQLAFLTIAATGHVSLTPGGQKVLAVQSLAIAPGGILDLAESDLVLHYDGTASPLGAAAGSAYTGVLGLIAAARAGGSWSGQGITTTAADAPAGLTSLGAAEASAVLALAAGQTAAWNGVTVDDTTVLVKYTYAGDANLDGFISGDDYSAMDFALVVPSACGWWNGDFNFDGHLGGDDYAIIDFNLAAQEQAL